MELQGPRVVLRPYRLDDYEVWREVRVSQGAWLEPWEPLGTGTADRYSYDEFARSVSYAEGQARADRGFRFGVFEGPALRGQVAINEISRGAFQNAYVGYWVDGRCAGKEYVPEGVTVALGFAFGPLRLHRVQASIIPRNERSVRVAEKVGMRREGLAQRYIQINGVWEDHYVYAITAEEWHGGQT